MKFKLPHKLILTGFVGLMLGSCTYGYDIKAIARNGRLVLTFDGGAVFGPRLPRVESLRIESVAKPSKPIWEIVAISPNGSELREVTYGEAPNGMGTTIGPSPPRIGQLYRVDLESNDGFGAGEFVISDEGEVLNLRN